MTRVRNGTNRVGFQLLGGESSDQHRFKLERSTDTQISWIQITMIPATNWYYGNYADTNFVANVTNYYRVRAFNIVGDST